MIEVSNVDHKIIDRISQAWLLRFFAVMRRV